LPSTSGFGDHARATNDPMFIAQACIVLVTVPTLAYINRRNPVFGARLVKGASAVIALAGLIWFVERVASYHYF